MVVGTVQQRWKRKDLEEEDVVDVMRFKLCRVPQGQVQITSLTKEFEMEEEVGEEEEENEDEGDKSYEKEEEGELYNCIVSDHY